ncbi:MAG: chorismate synthase [Bacilli bacterium]|nr:chorismate synthase [Bacilli bacterium]
MSNTIGEKVLLTLFGESHGPYVGAVIDGLSSGLEVNEEEMKRMLSLRRPSNKGETKRVEEDEYEIISGVYNGHTTGAPLTIIIPNKSVKSGDYDQFKKTPRPSHADYVAEMKYAGYQDHRGGGHFSGRVTAPIVAMGSILLEALKKKGIEIYVHIKKCAYMIDDEFALHPQVDLDELNTKNFPILNKEIGENMRDLMEKTAEEGDSLGGVIEVMIKGLPLGLGEPWFSSLEGKLSNAIFSIGAVKGIEFGDGFDFADAKGSEVNDGYMMEDGKVRTITNHNGGINGGISNGEPVIYRVAVKPTPSIYKPQRSVNLETKEDETLEIKGRHDPAIIRRICPVLRSMSALVIADLYEMRYGEDALR